jgi:hypothetical protein
VVVGSNRVAAPGGFGGLKGHMAACIDDGGVDAFLHASGGGLGFSGLGS